MLESKISSCTPTGQFLQRVSIACFAERCISYDRLCLTVFPTVGLSPVSVKNKKAELSQIRPRDAPNIWLPWKFRESSTSKRLLFPKFLMDFWVLYRSILRTCAQNWKFVALPFPEIIGVTEKFLAVPRYAHVPFSSQFLNGFCSHGRCEYTCQICVALPLSEIIGGTQKISAVPGYAHAPFSLIFKGLLFAWTLWIRVPNLKFVPLPVPKIIGGTEKITAVPWCAHAPFSPKFLRGFCSHRRCKCTCQIWNL